MVAASGGNHGLGVATAARIMSLRATVYVPRTTPEAKARRIAAQGARVVRHGDIYADAETAARTWAERSGSCYLHAYDDPAVIAGQGTIGPEIAGQAPWCDSVAVSVGGGGLAAGLSVSLGPDRPVVAVEPKDEQPARGLLGGPARRRPGGLGRGVGARRLPHRPARLRAAVVRGNPARAGHRTGHRLRPGPAVGRTPAGRRACRDVPLAAWLVGRVPGRHPCVVLCGANADWHPV